MVDLIHPHVRNTILRDIAVRACYVEHEAQAVAIEIADAAKHDVSARSRWHPYSGDGLSPRVRTDFVLVSKMIADMIYGPANMVMARGRIARFMISSQYIAARFRWLQRNVSWLTSFQCRSRH